MPHITSPLALTSPRYETRAIAADRIDQSDKTAWSALESRAIEPNAYLSPHFIIPAIRYLTPTQVPTVYFVERVAEARRELVGVGVFDSASPTKQFPAPRLVAYRSRHSFLAGLLLDRECVTQALQAMLEFIRDERPRYKGIEVPQVWADGGFSDVGDAVASSSRFKPRTRGRVPRAILVPAECPARLRDKALASRIRDLDRRMRRLRREGEVGWRCHREGGSPDEAVEAFLALEHMGWKGEEGSSLRSSADEEAFFREMVAGFASQGRALFTELTLNGMPIASICSLISGDVGFGFKIGWNPAFKSASPALLNELELMRNAADRFADIRYFDSGSWPDSYINELWLARRYLTTWIVPTRVLGEFAVGLSSWAADLKRLVRGELVGGSVLAMRRWSAK